MNQTEDMNVMKQLNMLGRLVLALAVMAVLVALAIPALAGSVADRAIVRTTGGTQVWTNNYAYSAVSLKRIWVEGAVIPNNTVTVSRVSALAYGGYTQSVGSVVCASGSGSTASFTASYLLPTETLVLLGHASSNFVSVIEFEVQQH